MTRPICTYIRYRALLSAACMAIAVLLCTVPSMAAESPTEAILPNGLKVILLENHRTPLVSFQVWYRVGSRNEVFGKTGLSHLLEHMMFKGTKKVGAGSFSRFIEKNGADYNAFTSYDYTAYYENINADRVEIPIGLESDRMHGLLLKKEDFETERSVVMEERRLRTEDDPKSVLHEQVMASAFQIQPYHWPVIGWMQDLRNLTVDDLKRYYSRYYEPGNAYIVVVGDFKKEEMLKKIKAGFGSLKRTPSLLRNKNREEPQLGERRIVVRKEARLASLLKTYHVPNIEEKDSYVLDVIETLLTGGESSRLYRRLVREDQLALSVDTDNNLLSVDPNLFSVSIDLLPGKKSNDVEKVLADEIQRLQTESVGDRELQKVKNQIEASFTFMQDSLFYQGMLLATYEAVSSWRDLEKYLPSIRKVSAEDIKRVAAKYFVADNCTTGVLEPLPPKEPQAIELGSPTKERTIR